MIIFCIGIIIYKPLNDVETDNNNNIAFDKTRFCIISFVYFTRSNNKTRATRDTTVYIVLCTHRRIIVVTRCYIYGAASLFLNSSF